MFSFENEAMLVEDREDLIAVLQMRFGVLDGAVIEKIYDISDSHTLQRLILAAANAPSYPAFLRELAEGEGAFRMPGGTFNPLEQ